jgi:hypothetical protein
MLYKYYIIYFALSYIYYSDILIYLRYIYYILIKRGNIKLKILEFSIYIKKYMLIKRIFLSYYSKKFPIYIKFFWYNLNIISKKNTFIILYDNIYKYLLFVICYFPYLSKFNFYNILINTYNFLFFTYHILYFLHL